MEILVDIKKLDENLELIHQLKLMFIYSSNPCYFFDPNCILFLGGKSKDALLASAAQERNCRGRFLVQSISTVSLTFVYALGRTRLY